MNTAVVLALLSVSLLLWPAEAEAAHARIEGFRFSCPAADGQTLKPANGDIEASVYTDLPVQRAQCRKAIRFKIGLCLDNTEFGSSAQGREFPDCLPVFEAQSQDCVRHFLRERAKCDAGSDSAAEAEDDPPAASQDERAGAAGETPYTVDPLDKVMVATKRARVFAGPGVEHPVLYTLEVGAGVRVTGRIRDREWLRVDRRKSDEAAFVRAPLLEEFVASSPGEAGPVSSRQEGPEARTQGVPERPAPDLPMDPEAAEAALKLTSEERSLIQRGLSAQGFDSASADGVFGARTRGALRAWQEKNGMPATGYLTSVAASTLQAAAGGEVKPPATLKPFGPNWIVVENQPCQIWNPHPVAGETVTWTGDCVDGKGSGKGRTVWTDSDGTSTHEGERWQGKRYGWGIVIEADGDRFEGEFRNNRAHGRGIFTWTDGRRYEGEWRSGKPHGHGTFTEPDGDRFEGNWIRGCFGSRDGRWAYVFTSAEACGFE